MNIKYKIFILIGLSLFTFSKSQKIDAVDTIQQGSYVFQYDDAGNQIFRGYFCPSCPIQGKKEIQEEADNDIMNGKNSEEFWGEIRIYPVPVRNVLTIDWSDKADALIAHVSIYEQNTVHWRFQQLNIPNLNNQIKIDMTNYYMGVYILTFTLKDGRVLSKNVTKF